MHTHQGRPDDALACGEIAVVAATALGGWVEDTTYAVLANAALAGGDASAAKEGVRGELEPHHRIHETPIVARAVAFWTVIAAVR